MRPNKIIDGIYEGTIRFDDEFISKKEMRTMLDKYFPPCNLKNVCTDGKITMNKDYYDEFIDEFEALNN